MPGSTKVKHIAHTNYDDFYARIRFKLIEPNSVSCYFSCRFAVPVWEVLAEINPALFQGTSVYWRAKEQVERNGIG